MSEMSNMTVNLTHVDTDQQYRQLANSIAFVSNQSVDEIENALREAKASHQNYTFTLYLATPGMPNPPPTKSQLGGSQELNSGVRDYGFNTDRVWEELSAKLSPRIAKSLTEQMLKPEDQRDVVFMALGQYLNVIAASLQAARSIISQTIAADGKLQVKMKTFHLESADQFMKNIDHLKEEIQKARVIELVMKILGPIIILLTSIVSVLITIFTFGAAAPAAVALCVVVNAAVTGLMVADACTGFIAKPLQEGMKNFVQALEAAGMSPAAAKAFIAIILIIAMVAMIALTAGMATGTIIQMELSISTVVLIETLTSVLSTFLMQMITSSGGLAAIFSELAKACGANKADAEIVGMVMQALALIILCIGLVKANAKLAGKAEKAVESGKAAVSGFEKAAKELASNIKQSVQETIDQVKTIIDNALSKVKNLLLGALEKIIGRQNLDSFLDSVAAISRELSSIAQDATKSFDDLTKAAQKNFDKLTEKVQEWLTDSKVINALIGTGTIGIGLGQVASAIVQGYNYTLILEKGETEASLQYLKNVVLKGLGISNEQLRQGMQKLMEQSQSIGKSILGIIDSQSQLLSGITNV